MFRVGIIGCGKIAQTRHIPEYLDNPYSEIAGYYDFNMKRAQELAEKYSGKAYESVEEMLSDDSVDAVSVCTSNDTHAEITIAALEAGKHVLCEKPMATTLEDCEKMYDAAVKNNRYLMIGMNQRLAKAHRKAKELIENGEIGRIVTFKTTFGHSGPETWSIDPGMNSWFLIRKELQWAQWLILEYIRRILFSILPVSMLQKFQQKLLPLIRDIQRASSFQWMTTLFAFTK